VVSRGGEYSRRRLIQGGLLRLWNVGCIEDELEGLAVHCDPKRTTEFRKCHEAFDKGMRSQGWRNQYHPCAFGPPGISGGNVNWSLRDFCSD
jgi:hypothetical protein